MMSRPLCIYHANCPDGFTAAWIVHRYSAASGVEVELYPGVYGTEPPDVKGRNVIMVDFTYPNDMMHQIASQATSLVVLDHHQTAIANLVDVATSAVVLDMDRSGARLAWDYFYANFDSQVPDIVLHVEDRDLWRFNLPTTRAYFAALTSHPYTLEAWDAVAAQPLAEVVAEGEAIERYRQRLIEQHVALAGPSTHPTGIEMPVVNCPYAIASDVAGELAKWAPNKVAAYYFDDRAAGLRQWGLRSTEDGPDVAAIAEAFGGGGHKHAAGFRTRQTS